MVRRRNRVRWEAVRHGHSRNGTKEPTEQCTKRERARAKARVEGKAKGKGKSLNVDIWFRRLSLSSLVFAMAFSIAGAKKPDWVCVAKGLECLEAVYEC